MVVVNNSPWTHRL